MDISQFRSLYPEYNDLSDDDLTDKIYNKYYSDMDRDVFESRWRPVQAEVQENFDDNIGTFSYLADIRDRGKAITKAIDIFNELEDLDDDSPEYQRKLKEFQRANEEVNFYSDEDNFFLGLGKALATDVAATLGGGAVGSLAGPVGMAAGAGAVGFERARRQAKVFNAYRELEETGDLTNEELRSAANTAILQAGLEGGADAITGGLGSKIAKKIIQKVALDATLGAGTEVGSQALQRAYVSNLDVLGEGAIDEYLQAAMEGAVAQGALSYGFHQVSKAMNPGDPDLESAIDRSLQDVEESRQSGFLENVVADFAQADNAEVAKELLRQTLEPTYRKSKTVDRQIEKLETKQEKNKNGLNDDELIKLNSLKKERDELQTKMKPEEVMGDLFNNEQFQTNIEADTVERPRFTFKDLNTFGRKRYTELNVNGKEKGFVDFNTSKKKGYITINDINAKNVADRVSMLKNVINYAKDNDLGVRSKGLEGDTKMVDAWEALKNEDNGISVKFNNQNNSYRVTSIPKNLGVVTKTVKTRKAVVKPTDEQGELFDKAPETRQRSTKSAEVEDVYKTLFPNDYALHKTLAGISDANLAALSKTNEYQQMLQNKNKIDQARVLAVADEATDIANEIVTKGVSPAAMQGNSLGQIIGRKAMEYGGPQSLLNQTANIPEFTENIGGKTEDSTINMISKQFPKWASSAKTLAKRFPQIAEIMSTMRFKLHTVDGLGKYMQGVIIPMRRHLKKLGIWEDTHYALEKLNRYSGKKINGKWQYKDTDGNLHVLPDNINEAVDGLNEYYKQPLLFARDTKQIQFENAQRAGEPEAAALIQKDLDKLNDAISRPYFPRRRFGTIFFKVGTGIYSLEEISGVNKVYPLNRIKVKDDLHLYKDDWNSLKERIKKEQGVEIGDPSKYFKENIEGKMPDQTMYRIDLTDPRKQRFDELLENEAILRLINDPESNRLKYFSQTAAGTKVLDNLLRPKRNIPGYSIDFDRLSSDAHSNTHRGFVNYLFEQPLRKLQAEYIAKNQPAHVTAYANRVFDSNMDSLSDNATRFQAFMALAFSPATAMLQTVSHITTVPLQMTLATNNPVEITKLLANPVSRKLFMSRIKGPEALTKYESFRKIAGAEFADFVFSHSRVFSNNPKLDFISSENLTKKGLSKAVSKTEEYGHGLMMRTEEATRLASAYSIFKMLKNPKYLQRVEEALKNDARVQDALQKYTNTPKEHIYTELLMDNAFGIYGKAGWAGFQDGWGRAVIPFASYPMQTSEMLLDHARGLNGKRAQLGAALTAMNMAIFFGMSGAPFYDVMENIYKFLNGLDNRPGREMDKDLFDAMYEINPDAAVFFKRGFVGELAGIDFSRRVTLSTPFNSIINSFDSKSPFGRDIGFLLPKAHDIREAANSGNPMELAKQAMPLGLANVVKGLVEYPSKGVTTKRGDVIIPEQDIEPQDYLKRIAGFNPISVANAQSAYYNALSEQNKYTGAKRRIIQRAYPKYKRWIESNKADKESLNELKGIIQDFKNMYERNGDIFTQDKYNGLMQSLNTAYLNEKGFTGGAPKSSLNKDVLAKNLEYFRQLEGVE